MGGVSKAVQQLGADGLDTDERASGEFVGAAYLYEYGAELSAKVLLALWVVGTLVPRVPQIVKHFQGSNEKKQLEFALPPPQEVKPEVEQENDE